MSALEGNQTLIGLRLILSSSYRHSRVCGIIDKIFSLLKSSTTLIVPQNLKFGLGSPFNVESLLKSVTQGLRFASRRYIILL